MSFIRARNGGNEFLVRPTAVKIPGGSLLLAQGIKRNGSEPVSSGQQPGFRFALGTINGVQPTALNTGVPSDVVLTPYSGDIIVTTPNTVIEKLDISGKILVRAANVTVRNCRIRSQDQGSGSGAVINGYHASCVNLLVEFCDIAQSTASAWFWYDGISGHSFTARYNRIHNVVDYFGIQGTSGKPAINVVIEGNFGENLTYIEHPTEPHNDHRTHNDGVQIQGNPSGVASSISIKGNAIWCKVSPTTSNATSPYGSNVTGQCITGSPQGSTGPIKGVSVDQNWLFGGSRHIIFIQNGQAVSTIGSITSNRLDNSANTAPRIQIDNTLTATVSSNVRSDTEAAVPATLVAPGTG